MTRWIRSCFFVLLALAAALAHAQAAWPTQAWQTASPESQGVDSGALQSLVSFGSFNQMDSLLVVRHGRIVLETHYAPFRDGNLHVINSATKSVLSTLVGMAIDKGLLPDARTPVLQLLPGRTAANTDARKQALTLQQLLDMTSGLEWDEPLSDAPPRSSIEMGRSRDWTQFVLDRPMAHEPGAVFNYNTGNSQLASAILSQATGMSAEQFAARELFAPLGITRWRWRQDPAGVSTGGFGLYLAPRDMAKFGLLALHHGEWDGRQLVPRAWMDKAFAASVPMNLMPALDFRYGNSWWAIPSRGATMAVGFHRQLVVLLPEHDVVVVVTGRRHYAFEQLLDNVLVGIRSAQPLPEDPAAQQALAARVRQAGVEPEARPIGTAPPGLEERVSGRKWKLSRNALGVQQFALNFGAEPGYEVVTFTAPGASTTRTSTYRFANGGRFVSSDGVFGPAVARAEWLPDGRLAVHTRFIEEGETSTYVVRFDGDKVDIDFTYSTGMQLRFTGEAVD
ncbi:MAG: beta-lactamase [Ramlibacter sp.]|nr:beta-lactamase [Ramlibacter sp.]